jgi:hypothetical protein
MKAALEKVGPELEFEPICSAFPAKLFDQFQQVSQEEAWKTWIDEKVFKRFFFNYYLGVLLKFIRFHIRSDTLYIIYFYMINLHQTVTETSTD